MLSDPGTWPMRFQSHRLYASFFSQSVRSHPSLFLFNLAPHCEISQVNRSVQLPSRDSSTHLAGDDTAPDYAGVLLNKAASIAVVAILALSIVAPSAIGSTVL